MSLLRSAKYFTKGYSDIQTKVMDATSNSQQPPTGSMMNELATFTYTPQHLCDMVQVLDRRLNDKGKNWRHVYKSLLVIDYMLHSGSEGAVLYFQKNGYIIKTLREFQYIDEEGKDQGRNVRVQSKNIANLLADEPKLREVRRNRAEMRDRMMGRKQDSVDEVFAENENHQRRGDVAGSEPDTGKSENAKALLAAMKKAAEDKNLANALKESKEDEEKRQEALKAASNQPLFDAVYSATSPATTANSNSNNPFPLVVIDGPSQPAAPLQIYIQPQVTAFDLIQQQQAQQEAMQAEYMRQQQEWMQQQAQQQAAQEAQFQAQMQMQAAQQAFFQQQQHQPSLLDGWSSPQMTPPSPAPILGSKNPFLSASNQASPASSPYMSSFSASTPSLLSSSSSWSVDSPSSLTSPTSPPFAPSNPTTRAPSPLPSGAQNNSALNNKKLNVDTDHLASLFATRDDSGMDTFGNVGQLRFGSNYHLPA